MDPGSVLTINEVAFTESLRKFNRNQLGMIAHKYARLYNIVKQVYEKSGSDIEVFELLPDEDIYKICQNMDLESLLNFVKTSRRNHLICNNMIKEKEREQRLIGEIEAEYKRIHLPGGNSLVSDINLSKHNPRKQYSEEHDFATIFTVRCLFDIYFKGSQGPYDLNMIADRVEEYNDIMMHRGRYIDVKNATKMDLYTLIDFYHDYDDEGVEDFMYDIMEDDKYFCIRYPKECKNPPLYPVEDSYMDIKREERKSWYSPRSPQSPRSPRSPWSPRSPEMDLPAI